MAGFQAEKGSTAAYPGMEAPLTLRPHVASRLLIILHDLENSVRELFR